MFRLDTTQDKVSVSSTFTHPSLLSVLKDEGIMTSITEASVMLATINTSNKHSLHEVESMSMSMSSPTRKKLKSKEN